MEELNLIFSNENRETTMEDINQMEYLERRDFKGYCRLFHLCQES